MFQVINWLCLISISFLILEIMVYFCKDAMNIVDNVKKTKTRSVGKTRTQGRAYAYEEKIAK